jgi:tetratricopeptide (TPR) repeat protein
MRFLVACAVGCLLAPLTASSAPPRPTDLLGISPHSPELERAQTQIENGDFEEAVKTLQAALSQADVSDEMLAEYYRLLGLAQLYLGDQEGARDAYEKLLQARPDFELPRSTPPKLRKLYARILEDIKRRRVRPVTLDSEPLAPVYGESPVPVQARITDLPLGAKARLYFRRAGAQTFSSVGFTRQKEGPDAYTAVVPAYEVPAEPHPYEVEYYLEVADAAQRRLAGKGDAFNPLTFTVQPRTVAPTELTHDEAWYKSPWVWVLGGAVAAGATTGIVLVATSKQTGTLTITIRTN